MSYYEEVKKNSKLYSDDMYKIIKDVGSIIGTAKYNFTDLMHAMATKALGKGYKVKTIVLKNGKSIEVSRTSVNDLYGGRNVPAVLVTEFGLTQMSQIAHLEFWADEGGFLKRAETRKALEEIPQNTQDVEHEVEPTDGSELSDTERTGSILDGYFS